MTKSCKREETVVKPCGALHVVTHIIPAPSLLGRIGFNRDALSRATTIVANPRDYLVRQACQGSCAITRVDDCNTLVVTNKLTFLVDTITLYVYDAYASTIKLRKAEES